MINKLELKETYGNIIRLKEDYPFLIQDKINEIVEELNRREIADKSILSAEYNGKTYRAIDMMAQPQCHHEWDMYGLGPLKCRICGNINK